MVKLKDDLEDYIYDDGYDQGYDNGYDDGYSDGVVDALNGRIDRPKTNQVHIPGLDQAVWHE